MTDRELMQQALEYLERHTVIDGVSLRNALRERLAQPETRFATREEKIVRPGVYEVPVARVTGYYAGRCVVTPLDSARVLPDNMALYAAPQQRKPLTDEQKFALVEKYLGLERYRSRGDEHLVIDRHTGRYTDAARYFDLIDETAHGIKE